MCEFSKYFLINNYIAFATAGQALKFVRGHFQVKNVEDADRDML